MVEERSLLICAPISTSLETIGPKSCLKSEQTSKIYVLSGTSERLEGISAGCKTSDWRKMDDQNMSLPDTPRYRAQHLKMDSQTGLARPGLQKSIT